MKDNKYCVIMAGGIGTRLWPKSRRRKPKQFLDVLGSGKSLIRQTYERFLQIVPKENILVVTTIPYCEMVREHIPELEAHQILCEPVGRNTAPCICYAAYTLRKRDPKAEIIATPTDHFIGNTEEYLAAIEECLEYTSAHPKRVTTIGIKPTHPETRYGYIQVSDSSPISKVKCFTEKPMAEVARQFIQHREFYWNSGLIVGSANCIISTIKKHLPQLDALFASIESELGGEGEQRAISGIYAECKPTSIDQGVMERASNVYVKCGEFGWSDVGTWGAIHGLSPKDRDNNTTSQGVFTFNTRDSYISTTPDKIAVVSGIDDYIIIDTEDLLMVCPKREEQEIKRFIDEVKYYKSTITK